MIHLYLIRHGEVAPSSPRRFVGQQDLALTERGRQEIHQLEPCLTAARIDRLVCSPLQRARESAGIIAGFTGIPVEVIPELAEISLGLWQGLTVGEVEERFPGQYQARGRDLAGFRPEGGESFADLENRVWPAFTRLIETACGLPMATAATGAKSLAVVAHAGVNRVLLCRILGMPLAHLLRLEQAYGCVNALRLGPDGYRLSCLNYRPA